MKQPALPGLAALAFAVSAALAQLGSAQTCVTVQRMVTRTVYYLDGSYTVTRHLFIETVCSPT